MKLANQRRFWFCSWATQRFALPALGRAAERRPTGKMLRRRKNAWNRARIPSVGCTLCWARFLDLDSLSLINTIIFYFCEPKFSLMRLQSPLPTNSSATFKISWISVKTSLSPAQCFLTISTSILLRRLFIVTAATTTSSM